MRQFNLMKLNVCPRLLNMAVLIKNTIFLIHCKVFIKYALCTIHGSLINGEHKEYFAR